MLVALTAGQAYVSGVFSQKPVSVVSEVVDALLLWWPWAVASLAIFALARWRSPIGPGWPTGLLLHLLTAGMWAGLYSGYLSLLHLLRHGKTVELEPLTKGVGHYLGVGLYLFLLGYGLVVIAGLLYDLLEHQQERRLDQARADTQAARLRELLSAARLRSLKTQMRPHFLFNALNTISSLLDDDPQHARGMIANLGDLLRASLELEDVQEVPLERELELLDRYLAIERARFGDRLQVTVEVDALARVQSIPSLLLQPLVENAVRHGVGRKKGPGHLWIRAAVEGDQLVLQVEDDGPGLPAGGLSDGEGIGLSNTRERLVALYGQGQHLEMSSVEGGGLRVTVTVPPERFAHEATG